MRKVFFVLTLFLFSLFSFGQQALWLRYPAISPDGKYIAFEYKGNIWKVPVSGGQAVPLTIAPGYEYAPVWSPDGKYIAYASDEFGNFDIFLMPSSGGKAKRLTYYSGNERPWTFSPDGKRVLYSTFFQKAPQGLQFPTGWLTELYSISTDGKSFTQVLATPAEYVSFLSDGKSFVYQDIKGVEDYWRKHHRSSVTRDLWIYNPQTGKHTKITKFVGEDRNPVVSPDGKWIYYLTEEFNNNLNVAKMPANGKGEPVQLTHFEKNPVRFLSIAKDGTLCFAQDGRIYTMKDGGQPQEVKVFVNYAGLDPKPQYKVFTDEATEMAVSKDGKYVAIVVRGDVYVTSVESGTTRQITNTPEQERDVDFSPDGKSIVYAGERNGSWNIYITKIADKDQNSFILAKKLVEEPVVATPAEEFQPKFSPDGKEVAYLENRTTLKVVNLKSHKTRKILDGKYNYSYTDGDQWFDWSPDGRWFLVSYSPHTMFISDVGLVKADGSGEVKNLTQSGYEDNMPKWVLGGKAMIWFSDRQGYRSHGSWGSERDVYMMFFDQQAYDVFKMTKDQYKAWKNQQQKKKKDTTKKVKPLKLNLNYLEDRTVRLTKYSGRISDAVLDKKGEKLFYAARYDAGYGLWMVNLRKHTTKLVTKLPGPAEDMVMTDNGLFLYSGGSIMKIDPASLEQHPVSYRAEKVIDYYAEKAYLFDHVWRLMKEKFYDPNMQGVDWDYYGQHYRQFLPYINNNYDFAEMLSEMLGELNASHTGSGYRPDREDADATAALGLLYDLSYTGPGVKIVEVLDKGPFFNEDTKVKPGDIIISIDNQPVNNMQDLFRLLNHKAGKLTVVGLKRGVKKWTETVRPISRGREVAIKYDRWVRRMRELTHKLSNGQIGYVHVKAMNSQSFRQVYSDALGKEADKKAIIIDTRFNTGGWLHDDLVTLFGGKKYAEFWPRGRYFGEEPFTKWDKKSVVLINEGNYSDGYGFPYAYHTLGLGKLIGMPIAGTMTAVWWETLMDPTLYFGIPQVGVKDLKGHYLENQQLNPDIKVWDDYDKIIRGEDQQLETAVKELLRETEQEK